MIIKIVHVREIIFILKSFYKFLNFYKHVLFLFYSNIIDMNNNHLFALYAFHQSPEELCKDIISNISFENDDILLEPFSGEDGFYKNFPDELVKYRCEIKDGLDFRDFDYEGIKPSVIISNPPFDLGESLRIRKNDFYNILMFFAEKQYIRKIVFLASSACYNSITPKRMMALNEQNLFLNKVTSCFIKKWRGVYYVMEFTRKPNTSFDYLLGVY